MGSESGTLQNHLIFLRVHLGRPDGRFGGNAVGGVFVEIDSAAGGYFVLISIVGGLIQDGFQLLRIRSRIHRRNQGHGTGDHRSGHGSSGEQGVFAELIRIRTGFGNSQGADFDGGIAFISHLVDESQTEVFPFRTGCREQICISFGSPHIVHAGIRLVNILGSHVQGLDGSLIRYVRRNVSRDEESGTPALGDSPVGDVAVGIGSIRFSALLVWEVQQEHVTVLRSGNLPLQRDFVAGGTEISVFGFVDGQLRFSLAALAQLLSGHRGAEFLHAVDGLAGSVCSGYRGDAVFFYGIFIEFPVILRKLLHLIGGVQPRGVVRIAHRGEDVGARRHHIHVPLSVVGVGCQGAVLGGSRHRNAVIGAGVGRSIGNQVVVRRLVSCGTNGENARFARFVDDGVVNVGIHIRAKGAVDGFQVHAQLLGPNSIVETFEDSAQGAAAVAVQHPDAHQPDAAAVAGFVAAEYAGGSGAVVGLSRDDAGTVGAVAVLVHRVDAVRIVGSIAAQENVPEIRLLLYKIVTVGAGELEALRGLPHVALQFLVLVIDSRIHYRNYHVLCGFLCGLVIGLPAGGGVDAVQMPCGAEVPIVPSRPVSRILRLKNIVRLRVLDFRVLLQFLCQGLGASVLRGNDTDDRLIFRRFRRGQGNRILNLVLVQGFLQDFRLLSQSVLRFLLPFAGLFLHGTAEGFCRSGPARHLLLLGRRRIRGNGAFLILYYHLVRYAFRIFLPGIDSSGEAAPLGGGGQVRQFRFRRRCSLERHHADGHSAGQRQHRQLLPCGLHSVSLFLHCSYPCLC